MFPAPSRSLGHSSGPEVAPLLPLFRRPRASKGPRPKGRGLRPCLEKRGDEARESDQESPLAPQQLAEKRATPTASPTPAMPVQPGAVVPHSRVLLTAGLPSLIPGALPCRPSFPGLCLAVPHSRGPADGGQRRAGSAPWRAAAAMAPLMRGRAGPGALGRPRQSQLSSPP